MHFDFAFGAAETRYGCGDGYFTCERRSKMCKEEEATWEDLYCVLYNDGRLRCFESKYKQEQKYIWHMRHFCLEEVDDEVKEGDAVDIVIDGHLLQLLHMLKLHVGQGRWGRRLATRCHHPGLLIFIGRCLVQKFSRVR